MITPLLSIIVPYRNHKDSLPRLLESIQRQSLKDLEVIIVDDKSETGCADIVAAFAGRGLDVRLLESERRLHVKDARLTGVRAAKADSFMFADADDMLWGDVALEKHVAMRRENQADMVHFRSVFIDEAGSFVGNYTWADPFAPTLSGASIFSAYVRSEIDGGAIWNKIFSTALWLRIMPELQSFPLKHACEDIFLNIRVFFQARTYMGSDSVGYGFHFQPEKQGGKALMRAMALCRMLDGLIPQLRSAGGDREDLDRLERGMLHFLAICTGRAGMHTMGSEARLGEVMKEALAQEDSEILIKTLLRGASINGKKLQNIYRSVVGL